MSAAIEPNPTNVSATRQELTAQLQDAGLVTPVEPVEFTQLTGGVSSDIWLVRGGDGRRFVVKRALAKLRVRDDWFADTSRNRTELAWFGYASQLLPTNVPKLIHCGDGWFAMEYLGDDLQKWKSELLLGVTTGINAARAGEFLGKIHRASWNDAVARETFNTGEAFHALRLEPYLLTTGARLPRLQKLFVEEANRLAQTRLALVHGDFSPKNQLVNAQRFIVLDAETAWFGDPAFDVAFQLTHLHLKPLLRTNADDTRRMLTLVKVFWSAYRDALGRFADADLEARTARLLLMILLARVHGKSPVEYLQPRQQEIVSRFGTRLLPQPPATIAEITEAWQATLTHA